jgi:alpha-ketoglutarate-dependent 2,4-dichlorophenoxyacetate dioxygenase
MPLSFRQLHPIFAAEVSAVDLRTARDRETLARIRAGMDEYAVLVFRDQSLTVQEQLAFAQRFDGTLHTKTGMSAIAKNRLGTEALSDVSNVGPDGAILAQDDRRRAFSLGNRLWHTDASFQDPAGRYSMLYACVVPSVRADTQFVDMRAAYDALDDEMKKPSRDCPRITRSPTRVRCWDSSCRVKKRTSSRAPCTRWSA